jgi:hypothetical protein
MAIRISQGKGPCDRYALLSERLVAELRAMLFLHNWHDSRHGFTPTTGGDLRANVVASSAMIRTRGRQRWNRVTNI